MAFLSQTPMQARLFFTAVWPCLAELWPLDPRLAEAAGEDFCLGLRAPGGLRLRMACEAKAFAVNAAPEPATLELCFFTASQVVATFNQHPAFPPLPWRGVFKLGMAKRLEALGKLMEGWLRPTAEQLADEGVAATYAWLQLGIGLRAVTQLAHCEAHTHRSWQAGPKGIVEFAMPGGHAPRWIELGAEQVRCGLGQPPTPADASVAFADVATAVASVRDELDAMAAVNGGRIGLTGLVPLADHLNHALERVPQYLER